jgi:hypothetical protein
LRDRDLQRLDRDAAGSAKGEAIVAHFHRDSEDFWDTAAELADAVAAVAKEGRLLASEAQPASVAEVNA